MTAGPQRLTPVTRGKVLVSAVAAIAAISAMVLLVDQLRHPLPSGGPPVPEVDAEASDPRTETICDDAVPREGQEREEPSTAELGQVAAVESNQLYDCPQTYDGRLVRYRGEVVGAVLRRSEGVWVQLNDDVYAEALGPLPAHRDFRGGNAGVGVLIPHNLADQISFVGGPKARGDVLEVVGVFHRVDPVAAEVAIIRAAEGALAIRGEPFEDPVLWDRLIAAALLVPFAAGVTIAERAKARRELQGRWRAPAT